MKRTLFLLSAAAAMATTAVLLSSPTLAAEQRCTELGANCVCSEPLNTTSYAYAGVYYNPGDTTSQECQVTFGEGGPGYALRHTYNVAGPTDVWGTNDPTILSRLPKRQSVLQYVARSWDGHVNELALGHNVWGYNPCPTYLCSRTALDAVTPGVISGSYVSKVRLNFRYYVYFSDNYAFSLDDLGPNCTNGKEALVDNIDLTHGGGSKIIAYNFGWGYDASTCAAIGLAPGCGNFKIDGVGGSSWEGDCCNTGPTTAAADQGPLSSSTWRGKWWRFEIAVTNRFGPGYRLQVFLKNVTDDQPEQTIIDTNGSYGWGGSNWVPSTQLVPSEMTPLFYYWVGGKYYGYRAGTCPGFVALSHFTMAQWDTNTGQRIGAAYEVEGGSPQPLDTMAPAAPTSLRVF